MHILRMVLEVGEKLGTKASAGVLRITTVD